MLKEFESIAQKIQIDFERTRDLPHQGVKGTARERAVTEEFLKLYLPPKYSIGSGLISDADGNFSKQQDIVIYDGFNFPVLRDLRDNKVFFAEQVLASIEVKSSLTHAEMIDIIDKAPNFRSVKRRSVYQSPAIADKSIEDESPMFSFGFAYNSPMSLSQIRDYAQRRIKDSASNWHMSSLIVLADRDGASGLITNLDAHELNRLKITPSLDNPLASVKLGSKGEALFFFYLQLMQAIQFAEAHASAPDYLAYARTDGFGGIDVSVGKIGMQDTSAINAIETLKKAHLVSKEQLLDAYYYLMKQGDGFFPGGSLYDKNTFFSIGKDRPVQEPRPFDVWESLNRYKAGTFEDQDRYKLDQLVEILRIVSREDTALVIFGPKLEDGE